jgi:hypothetical protein
MTLQLPDINLNGLLPIAALALIAGFCIIALLVRSVLHSRIALLIAVVIGVMAAGPTLANAAAAIVGALVPLGVVLIVGGVTLVWLLQRNPELMSLVRDLVPRRSTTTINAPQDMPQIEQSKTMVIDQLPAPRQTVKRTVSRGGTDDWGLR